MKFGIELTFIRWQHGEKLRKCLNRHYRKAHLDGDGAWFCRAMNSVSDHLALEIPSPVFKEIEPFATWYDKLNATVIQPFKLRTHYRTRDVIYDSGGGHVHCEIKKIDSQVVCSFLKANRDLYYLKWIFGHVCEKWLYRYERCDPDCFVDKCPSSIIVMSYNYPTLEHRFLDAPKNKREAIDFIELARGLTYLISHGHTFQRFDFKRRHDEDYVNKLFRYLLNEMELEYNRYARYFKRYLAWKRDWQLV